MMPIGVTLLGTTLLLAAAGYAVLALAARSPRPLGAVEPVCLPPLTVLKPLCGMEARLFENLATLCVQTHPEYQIVFGVRDPNDAAIAVVERLRAAYPGRVIDL